jgi:hypothetical protein
MASMSGDVLSGSTNGRPVKVAATAIASGTTIHTSASQTGGKFDEIYLWVTNTDTSDRTLTIAWGGTTDPDDLVCKAVSIPASSGPIPIITGLRLNNGLIVKAAASTANVLLLSGYFNRVS